MAAYDWKITMEYSRPLLWDIAIWRRELLPHDQRGPWSCVYGYEAYTWEGHLDPRKALAVALRSLAA